jgi:hypothetical protein
MRLAQLLRLTALGIAIMCWLDPPVVVAPQPPVPLGIAIVRSALDDMPAANAGTDTIRTRASAIAARVVELLGADADARVHDMTDPMRLPCDAQQPCVIVTGGGSIRVPADRRGHTSVVRVGEALAPNVAVTAVDVLATHREAAGAARVTLLGSGVSSHSSRVRLMDGHAVVGEAVHQWSTDGEATVMVPWWPIAAGTRALDAEAVTDGVSERTSLDNENRTFVEVADALWPVIVHERRPSWATTFVRRALDRDPRFTIDARTDVAPSVIAATTPAAVGLDEAWLDRARVVIVGAPETLTADEVTRLERFVRSRGGAVVLVPDRPFDGPVTRLVAHRWTERLDRSPSAAGELRASEWLVADAPTTFDERIAVSDDGPTIVSTPVGAGRVVVVGAMDAWRNRAADGGFDRFWRTTVAGLARAAGASVGVEADPRWSMPGEEVMIRVTGRTVRAWPDRVGTARLRCGDAPPIPIRLWPSNAPGAFVGRARPPASGATCTVMAALAGLGEGRVDIQVMPQGGGVGTAARTDLDALVARTGGLVVQDSAVEPLVEALRALRSDMRTPEARYPMRSLWWFPLIVACLSGEWWLRRRAGLR